jgi:hypothetical protein
MERVAVAAVGLRERRRLQQEVAVMMVAVMPRLVFRMVRTGIMEWQIQAVVVEVVVILLEATG